MRRVARTRQTVTRRDRRHVRRAGAAGGDAASRRRRGAAPGWVSNRSLRVLRGRAGRRWMWIVLRDGVASVRGDRSERGGDGAAPGERAVSGIDRWGVLRDRVRAIRAGTGGERVHGGRDDGVAAAVHL